MLIAIVMRLAVDQNFALKLTPEINILIQRKALTYFDMFDTKKGS